MRSTEDTAATSQAVIIHLHGVHLLHDNLPDDNTLAHCDCDVTSAVAKAQIWLRFVYFIR